MVDRLSPLGAILRHGTHGHLDDGIGVSLSELQPGSIVQLAAWPGREDNVLHAIERLTGHALTDAPGVGFVTETVSAFGFAPRRFLLVHQEEGIFDSLAAMIGPEDGAITDLSHGRTAFRVAGPHAEWVLSKLFAVDVSLPAFALGTGRSTAHHDVFAQIQRSGATAFDIYVFRSLARSFWTTLCKAAEEKGYEVD